MSPHRRRAEDHPGIVGWISRPARRVTVGVLFLLLCALIGLQGIVFHRIAGDEHSTCKIQARGLPAGHELAASMADIHALLTFPPTAAQKRNQQEIPPAQLRHELAVIRDLNVHLSRYSKLESEQPRHRNC